ncbi:hypothetical protein MOB28_18645, partial [Bacillus haynesii]|nr:hypothetical protein [Bacillus haynesii]
MKKSILGIFTALCLLIFPQVSFADAAVGDVIVTLGKDLSSQDRQKDTWEKLGDLPFEKKVPAYKIYAEAIG